MQLNDDTTAEELTVPLQNIGITVSRGVVLKGQHLLGWSSCGTAYCKLIRQLNKE